MNANAEIDRAGEVPPIFRRPANLAAVDNVTICIVDSGQRFGQSGARWILVSVKIRSRETDAG